MCAKADYREGLRALAEEWRRAMQRIKARWRHGSWLPGIRRPANASRPGFTSILSAVREISGR